MAERLVRDALADHHRTNGLPADGGASAATFTVHLGRIRFRLPNPPARQRAVMLHDINHVATGYDTRFTRGEVQIAAFEVGAGCGRFPMVWFINLAMMAIGLLVRPVDVLRAFSRGRRSSSIYRQRVVADAIGAMTLPELRRMLRID